MLSESLERLIAYAEIHLGLLEEDVPYKRNLLLSHFGLEAPFEGTVDAAPLKDLKVPDTLVESLVNDLVSVGMEASKASRESTFALGVLTPDPSAVHAKFNNLYKKNVEEATEYLYDLSIKNDYIAKTMVDKNIHYDASYKDGPSLEISINLSKPEKNNKDIAKLMKPATSFTYPKCLLCRENIGFEGNDKHPARENIRFIPITLGGGRWFLQYSPYVYYSHHCIVFYEHHVPMEVSNWTLGCLFDFVDQFPNFFIGSNSDLPIVGGSILNHEHFQGGGHLLPLLIAKDKKVIPTKLKHTTLSIVDFYDTALKLRGNDRSEMLSFATKILLAWKSYDDPANLIISHDDDGAHSTVTPLLRKIGNVYEMTLILRNNRCDKDYPDGIFHAHPQYHHIKKEGIGLIEAAGLFILPARLERQGKEVEDIVKRKLPRNAYLELYPDLEGFGRMVSEMEEKGESARDYMASVCQLILKNVAVYKDTPEGNKGLMGFLKGVI